MHQEFVAARQLLDAARPPEERATLTARKAESQWQALIPERGGLEKDRANGAAQRDKRALLEEALKLLQVAMGVLDSLQQRGTQVGLISHVGDLADRIGAQVRVERVDVGQGLSRVRVFPETQDRPPVSAPTSTGR